MKLFLKILVGLIIALTIPISVGLLSLLAGGLFLPAFIFASKIIGGLIVFAGIATLGSIVILDW